MYIALYKVARTTHAQLRTYGKNGTPMPSGEWISGQMAVRVDYGQQHTQVRPANGVMLHVYSLPMCIHCHCCLAVLNSSYVGHPLQCLAQLGLLQPSIPYSHVYIWMHSPMVASSTNPSSHRQKVVYAGVGDMLIQTSPCHRP